MKRYMLTIGVLALSLILLSTACKTVDRRKNLENCEFKLDSIEIKDVTLSDVTIVAQVKIHNPNDDKVILDMLDYQFYSNKTLLAEGCHKEQVDIEAGTSEIVSISAKSKLKNLGGGILDALSGGGDTVYTIMGTGFLDTFVGTVEIPFSTNLKK